MNGHDWLTKDEKMEDILRTSSAPQKSTYSRANKSNAADSEFWFNLGAILLAASVVLTWLTHVVWWIVTMMGDATMSQMVLGFAAILIFPLGIIHGYIIWTFTWIGWGYIALTLIMFIISFIRDQ